MPIAFLMVVSIWQGRILRFGPASNGNRSSLAIRRHVCHGQNSIWPVVIIPLVGTLTMVINDPYCKVG